MAVPAYFSLEFYRGDDFRKQFRLWADKKKTIPADLTGAEASADIRAAPMALPAASLECVITGNVIDVSLPGPDTILVPKNGYWDLQITYASGEIRTVVAGGVSVRPGITRPGVIVPGRKAAIHA